WTTVVFVPALILMLAIMAPALWSQTTTGVILGTVLDSSGAVIPGVSIQITNEETGAVQNTVTDEAGRYNIPALQVSTYDVQASLVGFQTLIKKKITLTVGGQSVIDFTLQVGQTQEAVTVQADTVQVETTTSDIGTLIAPVQMAELPLNGRNFEQLIMLGAGVQNISTNNHGSFYGNG